MNYLLNCLRLKVNLLFLTMLHLFTVGFGSLKAQNASTSLTHFLIWLSGVRL